MGLKVSKAFQLDFICWPVQFGCGKCEAKLQISFLAWWAFFWKSNSGYVEMDTGIGFKLRKVSAVRVQFDFIWWHHGCKLYSLVGICEKGISLIGVLATLSPQPGWWELIWTIVSLIFLLSSTLIRWSGQYLQFWVNQNYFNAKNLLQIFPNWGLLSISSLLDRLLEIHFDTLSTIFSVLYFYLDDHDHLNTLDKIAKGGEYLTTKSTANIILPFCY